MVAVQVAFEKAANVETRISSLHRFQGLKPTRRVSSYGATGFGLGFRV
jgi:hypothetical protein